MAQTNPFVEEALCVIPALESNGVSEDTAKLYREMNQPSQKAPASKAHAARCAARCRSPTCSKLASLGACR
jgi:hypothetical protein